jgi:ABC-2 type transport system ATP-binding protein
MAAMISIKDLHKTFGPITAVDGVSFDVDRGEVLGFLGPNGAGKSTTMKMVTGFLPPTRGTAVVCGHDVLTDALAVKKAVGYLPEGAPAYSDMTPDSFLRFVAEVRGYRGRERRDRVEHVSRLVQLEEVLRQPIDTMSKGYKRRVGLAQALIHDPEVLIMDEPTDGLDPNQKHEVRALIRDMAEQKAIVLSTHILEEVEAVCTRAIVIARGRIVADGTPSDLQKHSVHHNAVTLAVRADENAVVAELEKLEFVASVERLGCHDGVARCRVFPKNGRSILPEVSQHVRAREWSVDELHVEEGRLNEVFRRMTLGDAPAPKAPKQVAKEVSA